MRDKNKNLEKLYERISITLDYGKTKFFLHISLLEGAYGKICLKMPLILINFHMTCNEILLIFFS